MLGTSTDGFHDLEVVVMHRTAQWAAGDQGYIEEGVTEIWQWDGAAYALSESVPID